MELCKKHSIERITDDDIYNMRDLMYKAKARAGRLDDPLVLEISQILYLMLNLQRKFKVQ